MKKLLFAIALLTISIVQAGQITGKTGIGKTAGSVYKLDVDGYIKSKDGIYIEGDSSSAFTQFSDGTNAAYIGLNYSDTHFRINNTSALSSAEHIGINTSGHIFFDSLNTLSSQSDVQYNTSTGELGYVSSSKDVKENIVDLTDSDSNFIYNLKPRKYDRKDGSNYNELGLIAEEVEAVNSKLACKNSSGKTVTYSRSALIIPMLHQVQIQKQEIDSLKTENETLKKQLADIVKRLEALEKK